MKRWFKYAVLTLAVVGCTQPEAPQSTAGDPGMVDDVGVVEAPARTAHADARFAIHRAQSSRYGAEVLRATHPTQPLDVWFPDTEVRLVPRTDAPTWEIGLSLAGWGRSQARSSPDAVPPTAIANEVTYTRPGLTEWYVHEPRGVEQGFTVHQRPDGEGPLVVSVALDTDLDVLPIGTGLGFTDETGRVVATYDGLVAWDADGDALAAAMHLDCAEADCLVELRVEDGHADYPITVDPVVALQVQKIFASDPQYSDDFGNAVSTISDRLIVGARGDRDFGSLSGAVYIFARDAGTGLWSEVSELHAHDAEATDYFGDKVSITDDYAITGAGLEDELGDSAGAAYLFARRPEGTVLQTGFQTLGTVAADPTWALSELSTEWWMRFGDVALGAGNQMAVSTAFDDAVTGGWHCTADETAVSMTIEFANADASHSVAYAFAADEWYHVACQYDGADLRLFVDGVEIGSKSWVGAVEYTSQPLLLLHRNSAITGAVKDYQVRQVRVGDTALYSSTFLPNWDLSTPASGTVAFYPMDDGVGTTAVDTIAARDAALTGGVSWPTNPERWSEILKLLASDGVAGDRFGTSVAVDGTYAVIGANKDDGNGTAFVFERDAATGLWVEVAKLTASDGDGNDYFGAAVALQGSTALVSASSYNMGQGKVYVFERDSGTGVWSEVKTFMASVPVYNSGFGSTLAMDADRAVVGAQDTDELGNSAGSAHVFEVNGGTGEWTEVATLLASDGDELDKFGRSVDIDGDRVIVGSGKDLIDDNSGQAYLFERDGTGTWSESCRIAPADTTQSQFFGSSVGVFGDLLVIGADGDREAANSAGALYIYDLVANTPPVLVNNGATLNEGYGYFFATADLEATDAEQPAPLLTYTLDTLPADGELRLDVSLLAAGETFTQYDIDNGAVWYAHDGSEAPTDSFDFTLSDSQDSVSDTFVFTMNPINDPPVSDAGGPYAGIPHAPVALDGSGSYDVDGTVVLYMWDCETDGSYDISSALPTGDACTYDTEGTYTLTLRARDDDDSNTNDTATVDIAWPPGPATLTDTTADVATTDGTIDPVEYPVASAGINAGFADVIGTTSRLWVDSDECGDLAFGLQKGAGDFNDMVVIYIDSVAGGYADTASFTDQADMFRRGISGYDGSNQSILEFAPGFEADFAIAVQTAALGDAGLFDLELGSHTFVKTLTQVPAPIAPTAPDHEISGLDLGDLGLLPGDSFDFVVTYLNSGNVFRSDEFIGVDPTTVPGPSPGYTTVTLAAGDFLTFVSAPSSAPVAEVDSDILAEGADSILDVSDNDSDAYPGLDLTSITITTDPTWGIAVPNGDGTVTYTHDDSENHADSYAYTIADQCGVASDPVTVTLTVNPVNDAPELTVPGSQSVDEDQLRVLPAISVADDDVDQGTDQVEVSLSVADGILNLADTTGLSFSSGSDGTGSMTFSGLLADVNTALSAVEYDSDLDFNGGDSLSVSVNDLGNYGSGGPLPDSGLVAITVDPVDDPPALTLPGPQIASEDLTLVLPPIGITDIDVEEGTGEVEVALSVVSGTLTLAETTDLSFSSGADGTKAMTFSGLLADVVAALAAVDYTPTAGFNGDDTLEVAVNDLGNWGLGGPQADEGTIAVTVNPVNNAPELTLPGAQEVDEDQVLALPAIGVSDVDVDEGTGQLEVVFSATSGTLTLADTTGLTFTVGGDGEALLSFYGLLADVQAALVGVDYAPGPHFNGVDTLSVSVHDLGSWGAGGSLSDTGTIEVTVNAVDDEPVLALPTAQVVDEDQLLVLPGIEVTDLDAAEGSGEVEVALSVTSGTLTLAETAGLAFSAGANASGSMTFSGLLVDINTALAAVVYDSDPEAHGGETVHVSVSDLGNTGEDGPLTDAGTIDITVYAIDDAPVLALPGAQSVDEDQLLGLPPIGISDVDLAEGTDEVEVTLTATSGTLTLVQTTGLAFSSGADATKAMTFTGLLADVEAALAALQYDSDPDFNGLDAVAVTVGDLGNFGGGGPLSDGGTIEITVDAVDDAPVLSVPGTQTVAEDDSIGITGISIADVDLAEGTDELEVSLSATSGTLTLAQQTGLTFSAGADGTSAMTFTGLSAAVADALATLTYAPTAHFDGGDAILIDVSDLGNTGSGGPRTDAGSIDVTVTPDNDDPFLVINEPLVVAEGGTGVLTRTDHLRVDDLDNTPDELVFTVAVAPTHGDVLRDGVPRIVGGTFTQADIDAELVTYTHDDTETPSDSFDFTVSDGAGGDLPQTTFLVDIGTDNDAPQLINNTGLTLDEGTSEVLTAVELLVTDIDNTPIELVYTLLQAPTNGVLDLDGVLLAADDTFTQDDIDQTLLGYIHDGSETTADLFDFSVSDGVGGQIATTTFHITIDLVDDPPVQATNLGLTLLEGATASITDTELFATDADHLASEITFTLSSLPANGVLALDGTGLSTSETYTAQDLLDGLLTYTHDGSETTADAFDFVISDAAGATLPVDTFDITVIPDNDAPVAVDDGPHAIVEDTPLTVATGSGVLSNDNDAEGDTLTTVIESYVQHGALDLAADGSFTYTPEPDYTGDDDFTYRAYDGALLSAPATVSLAISASQDAPVALDDNYTGTEDETLNVVATSGVLVNDEDADGEPLSATLVDDVLHGTLALSVDGSFTYAPEAHHDGWDRFTYTAGDGTAQSGPATVLLTLDPVNDAPIGVQDSYLVEVGVPLEKPASEGVLGNDIDVEGDVLTASLDTAPSWGTLTLDPDGSFEYIPDEGFLGIDQFFYTVSDGALTSGSTEVDLEVVGTILDTADTGLIDDTGTDPEDGDCGCSSSNHSGQVWWLVGLLGVLGLRRRRC
ncbi:MAG: tandem-95 repeat protein [Deltaproteobacteria bacterium]|nr:tandem-95 repeat protein [Deltaproteobacteria bacterium]